MDATDYEPNTPPRSSDLSVIDAVPHQLAASGVVGLAATSDSPLAWLGRGAVVAIMDVRLSTAARMAAERFGSSAGGTYPPLAQVRERLKVGWYRSPLAPGTLRQLMQRSDLHGWLQAGGHLLLLVALGVLTFWLWSTGRWTLFGVALFAHGTVASFMVGVAPHELAHGTVFRTRWLNTLFLYTFSLLSWWDPFDYGTSHTYHHRYTQYREGDRENLLPLHPSVGPLFVPQLFTINLLSRPGRVFGKGGLISAVVITAMTAFGAVGSANVPAREWIRALHLDQPDEARKSRWWARAQLLFHGGVVAAGIVTGLWVLPILISAAPFIAGWLSYAVGMTQHCGLRGDVADFRKSTRSIKLDPITSFLYWRMGWHIEHHMYAGVPCYQLKKLARAVANDMPPARTLLGAWREMRLTWRRQQADSRFEYDTPLPATAGVTRPSASEDKDAEAMAASIGELPPPTLAEDQ